MIIPFPIANHVWYLFNQTDLDVSSLCMDKIEAGKLRDEDSEIFGLPDPVLFSLDPDPTCNNGPIKLFSS